MNNDSDSHVVVRKVNAFIPTSTRCYDDDPEAVIRYTDTRLLGNGSFGVVYQAKLVDTNELVAIKKVLQDRRFKVCGITNRELLIMRKLKHPNIVRLMYYFYSKDDRVKVNEEFLNLVLEYFPDTVYRVSRVYARKSRPIPMFLTKLYMYQVFRALAYLHSLDICHRDVKPQNMLVHTDTGVVKLCDFGSAKYLINGEPNVSYICSRYYRPPELIFGSQIYTTSVDVWSAGCVFGELFLGRPMFAGETAIDQLVEIIKVLGTPTADQIFKLNPNFGQYTFPNVRSQPLIKYFEGRTPANAIALISKLLEYAPGERTGAWRACAHEFFDELRMVDCRLSDMQALPPLFNFTKEELDLDPTINAKLIPAHLVVRTDVDAEFDRTMVEEYNNENILK